MCERKGSRGCESIHCIPTDIGPIAKRGLSHRLIRLHKRRVDVGWCRCWLVSFRRCCESVSVGFIKSVQRICEKDSKRQYKMT